MEQGRSFYASISGPNMPRIYGVEVILGKALGWWTRTWGLGRRPGRGGVSESEGRAGALHLWRQVQAPKV